MFNEPSPDSPARTRDRLIGAMLEAQSILQGNGIGAQQAAGLYRPPDPRGFRMNCLDHLAWNKLGNGSAHRCLRH